MSARFEVYRDDAGEHRWRLVSGNGAIVAVSGEGFEGVSGARKSIDSTKRTLLDTLTQTAPLSDSSALGHEVVRLDAEPMVRVLPE